MAGSVNPGSLDTVVLREASHSNKSCCCTSSLCRGRAAAGLQGRTRSSHATDGQRALPSHSADSSISPTTVNASAGRGGERAASGRHRCWATARFSVSRKALKNRRPASGEATSCPSIDALRICQLPGSGGRDARDAERMEHRERKAYTQIGATAGWG